MRVYSIALPVIAIVFVLATFSVSLAQPQPEVLGLSTTNTEPISTFEPESTTKPQVVSSFASEPSVQVATVYEVGDLENHFTKYSSEFGIDKALLVKIAKCESNFNPNAINGPYKGMFQFTESSWRSARNLMGLDPDPNLRFNAEEAIRTTSFLLSQGRIGMWPACSS